MDKKTLHIVAFLLVMVGGLNWGILGIFGPNLVHMLLESMPTVERLVYILVGLSTVYVIAMHKNDCKICGKM